jgi:ABC-type phosphate/phosphonate transport system permease subunit
MNLFQPFKELNLINKHLGVAIISLFVYYISRIFSDASYALRQLFDGELTFTQFFELFNYGNFVYTIAIVFLYLAIRKKSHIPINEREEIILTSIITIFAFSYLLSFFFIERIISLTPTGANSLPNSPSDFFPFDWYDLTYNYENLTSGFVIDYYVYTFIFTLISAIAIIIAILAIGLYLKSEKSNKQLKISLRNLVNEVRTTQRKVILILLSVPFIFLSIENIKASDYTSLQITASIMQDDLEQYKEALSSANNAPFETDIYEARKVAATKVYEQINTKYDNLESDELSFWSGNLIELRDALLTWISLWEKNLKEVSLNGYADKGIIFDLNQQYYKLNKLGVYRAPALASDYQIEFWQDEFYPLVK